MTMKKLIIFIEPHGSDEFYLQIYSDLSKEDVEGVEGIVSVSDVALRISGFLLAMVSKRYNPGEVEKALTDLAVKREAENT